MIAGARWAPRRLAPVLSRARSADALGVAAAAAAVVLLLVRLLPDVATEPLVEDEAVAGSIGARPLGEVLGTVLLDRGGAPLHFVLAHLVFVVEPSASALRALSVALAAATVALCYDLGRRVGGPAVGAMAAWVAATSTLLGIYGTFGRMYALLACVAALAADTFVRAVERRTTRAVALAAVAAWLLPAAHPYGLILAGAEAVVAIALWRGRPRRAAVVPALAGLAMVPFLVADLRLADRFAVGTRGSAPLASPGEALSQTGRALASFAGGRGVAVAVFAALGVLGLVRLARSQPVFAGLTAVTIAAPPLLLAVVRTGSTVGVSPRHLAFALPLWACAVGAGAATVARLRPPAAALGLAAIAALAVVAPAGGIRDPREKLNVVLGGGVGTTATGGRTARRPAEAWLSRTVGDDEVLLPYSAVFLAALPATRHATSLPYAQPRVLRATLGRAAQPVRALVVAVPLGRTRLDRRGLEAALGPHDRPAVLGQWLLIRAVGPFPARAPVLRAACRLFAAARTAVQPPLRIELAAYLGLALATVRTALAEEGGTCPRATAGRGAR